MRNYFLSLAVFFHVPTSTLETTWNSNSQCPQKQQQWSLGELYISVLSPPYHSFSTLGWVPAAYTIYAPISDIFPRARFPRSLTRPRPFEVYIRSLPLPSAYEQKIKTKERLIEGSQPAAPRSVFGKPARFTISHSVLRRQRCRSYVPVGPVARLSFITWPRSRPCRGAGNGVGR